MEYRSVTSISEIERYIRGAEVVSFDLETAPDVQYRTDPKTALDPHKSHIAGVSFSVGEGSGIYVPIAHRIGENADKSAVMAFLAEFAANQSIIKAAHNLAFESMFLYKHGIVMQEPVYDTIAAAQMTLKGSTTFRTLADSGLKTLVPDILDIELPSFSDVTGGRHFDELDPQDAETVRYACADADYALRLYHILNEWFDRWLPKHRNIVEKVESPAAVYAGLMKYNGVLADRELMLSKKAEAEEKLAKLRSEIHFIIGDVNIGANANTAAFKSYLFNDLGLPVVKTTAKSREAADDETLILLTDWCAENRPELVPLFGLIKEYRRWGKLLSTYIEGYMEHINDATGRIHANLFPLGTTTGRFAAQKPNLQNCFDAATEILTKRGFVLFADLQHGDVVAQWENGEITFVEPLDIINQNYSGDMIKITNQHINLCMTPEHRCLLQSRKTNKWLMVDAKDYQADAKQLHAGQYSFGKKKMNIHQIILVCAIQADGGVREGGAIEFTFTKERKYYRLKYALDVMKVNYNEGVKGNGQYRVYVPKSNITIWINRLLGEKKTWGAWLLEYDRYTVKTILREIEHWDGCFTRGNYYSSSIKENADWMQIIYMLTGTRAHLREYWNKNPNSVVNYQIDIADTLFSQTANAIKEIIPYTGTVHCVTVPSGVIVVRRGNQVCITGNCPRPGNDDVGVRNFFVAPEGKVLLSLDFSQIELRVGAFYCRDEKMLETYQKGGDIHAQTTAVIYNIPFEQAVDKRDEGYKERRTIAKNCNFGVFFGLFAKGLQRNLKNKAGLNTTLEECESILGNPKAGYPALALWQEGTKMRAKSNRYTETWLGRRRYLPDIGSQDWGKKSFAERCALNTPIQGTAADILKLALGRIIGGLPDRAWLCPLMQVHDQLDFELPAEKVGEAIEFLKSCMETKPFTGFDVRIVAEAAVGTRYGEMKEPEETE